MIQTFMIAILTTYLHYYFKKCVFDFFLKLRLDK